MKNKEEPARREFLYGINPASELLRAESRQVFQAFVNSKQKNSPRLKRLVNHFGSKHIPVSFCHRDQLYQKAGTTEHQGIVIEVSPYRYARLEALWQSDRLLLIDNVEDPHNLGAILRSAEVFGFQAVLISKKGVPEIYPSVVKASAGATEFLHINKVLTANDYTKKAKENGYRILALDAKGDVPIAELPPAFREKFLLVIGGEDKGVGQYILNEADAVISLKQQGSINSLNASVAAGIALHSLSNNSNLGADS